jgi:hypothetical protein
LGCLPLWGREGVTLAIFTPAQKNARGFLQSRKIHTSDIKNVPVATGYPANVPVYDREFSAHFKKRINMKDLSFGKF